MHILAGSALIHLFIHIHVFPLSVNALEKRIPIALLSRRDTCTNQGSTTCDVRNNGKSFCCPVATKCIPLEANTSAICCNDNDICDEIKPIPCSSSGSSTSDGTSTSSTVKCGSQCCPAGFDCLTISGNATCKMTDKNLPPEWKKHRETQAAAVKKTCEQFMDCPAFPTKAIVTGFFPGILVGVAIMFLYTYFTTYRTNRRSIQSWQAGPRGNFRSVIGNGFSDPEPVEKIVRRPSTPAATRQTTIQIGFSPHQDASTWATPPLVPGLRSPGAEYPTPNLSPNLGPTIPPREYNRSRSSSRDRTPEPGKVGLHQPPSRLQYSSSAEGSERGSVGSHALREGSTKGRGRMSVRPDSIENGHYVAPESSLGPFGLDDEMPRSQFI